MNKISEEHLKKVQDQQKELNEVTNNIGYLEAQKHAFLHKMAEINKDINDFKDELEKEYGQVNINVETGEFSPLAKQEEVADLKAV